MAGAIVPALIAAGTSAAGTTANIIAGSKQQQRQEEQRRREGLRPGPGGPVQGIQAPQQDLMAMLMQLAQSSGAGQVNPRL